MANIEDRLIEGWAQEKTNLFRKSVQPKSSEEIWATGGMSGPGTNPQADMNFHTALDLAGIVNPGADVANAILYATKGKFGMAALSTVGVVPVLGDYMKHLLKSWKAIDKGEETVTLYRAVRGVDDPEVLIKGDKIVGDWGSKIKEGGTIGRSASLSSKPGDFSHGKQIYNTILGGDGRSYYALIDENIDISKALFTTHKKSVALQYLKAYGKNVDGMLLEFKVPKSYLNKHGRDGLGSIIGKTKNADGTISGGWGSTEVKKRMNQIYPEVSFVDGLPVETLRNISTIAGK